MGVVAGALRGIESLWSRINAWRSSVPHLYPDRFAHPHEFERLRSDRWHNETSLLIGISSFNQVLTVRQTDKRRELGNLLVCAPPRSGKSILATSQLLTWPHSSINLDIKGELYDQTAAYLRERGHKILVLDPTGVGNQFDPLHGRTSQRQLYAVAKYLLYEAGERDPIFIERAIKMLVQLFLADVEENHLAGRKKYHLLPYALQLMDLPINQIAAHLQALSPELATTFLSGAYNPAKDYDEKKFLTSSWESADARLYPIRAEEILRCFDGSDLTGEEIITSKQPITVYLRIPEAELLPLAPVVRLVFQTLIHDLITTYDTRPGRTAKEKGCYPVLVLLDEAGRTKIPNLYEYASTVVGRQVSLWIAIQSVSQLQAYGWANAETLLDNLDTQIFYSQKHATAKYLSEALGRKSEYSRSESKREGGGESQGLSEQGVPLLTPAQIRQLADEDIVVFHHNLPPFRAKRMNWREHQFLRQRQALRPPEPQPLPPLTPIKLHYLQTSSADVADNDPINPADFE